MISRVENVGETAVRVAWESSAEQGGEVRTSYVHHWR